MAAVESIPVTITGRIVGTSMTSESLMKGGEKRAYQKGVPNDKRQIVMENGKPVREWYMRVAVSKTGLDALGNQNGGQSIMEAIFKQASNTAKKVRSKLAITLRSAYLLEPVIQACT